MFLTHALAVCGCGCGYLMGGPPDDRLHPGASLYTRFTCVLLCLIWLGVRLLLLLSRCIVVWSGVADAALFRADVFCLRC